MCSHCSVLQSQHQIKVVLCTDVWKECVMFSLNSFWLIDFSKGSLQYFRHCSLGIEFTTIKHLQLLSALSTGPIHSANTPMTFCSWVQFAFVEHLIAITHVAKCTVVSPLRQEYNRQDNGSGKETWMFHNIQVLTNEVQGHSLKLQANNLNEHTWHDDAFAWLQSLLLHPLLQ